jgi:glycosyltransferase involved in cell wall biosynthesis
MKLVHVITSLDKHGSQMMLFKLLSGLNQGRFDSVVISLAERGAMRELFAALGVPVYSLGMPTGLPTPSAGFRLIRLLRQLHPDLIQGWMYHGNLAAQFGARFLPRPTPVLWNVRGSSCQLRKEKLMTAAVIWFGGKLSRLPHSIINNSLASAIQHEEALGYKADRRVIIANGFDTDTFAPSDEARRAIRRELGVDENALLIGLMARYHPMKDHANFLRAAAILSASHPQTHFVLAGQGVDGNNRALSDLIQNLSLGGRVHLLGERDDTSRLAGAFDIATSASAFGEGFANVIGEAMSCGVPCVATTIGDSAFIIGDTGLAVPPCDSDALAAAWRELIEMGSARRLELGAAARRRVIENFSISAIIARYEALYTGLVSASLAALWKHREPNTRVASPKDWQIPRPHSQDHATSQLKVTEHERTN